MGDPATDQNIDQYYGGGIYCCFSIHEGRTNFCKSYEIDFVLELQGDTPKVLFRFFENPVTFHEYNQG